MKTATITSLFLAAALSGINALPNSLPKLDKREQVVKSTQPVDDILTAGSVKAQEAAPQEPEQEKKQKAQGGDNSGEGQGVSTYTPFCSGGKAKRATLESIAYEGNTGAGGDYGCNMMLVQKSVAKEYNLKVEVINELDKEQSCVYYNKIGREGKIDGFIKGNEAGSFKIPAKSTQFLAIDKDTQGGVICHEGTGDFPADQWGVFGSTWAEFDFASAVNNGWSGADASCLVASRADMPIPGMQICEKGSDAECSIIYPGGAGKNAFTEGMEAEDGWGLNIPKKDQVHLIVQVGFQG